MPAYRVEFPDRPHLDSLQVEADDPYDTPFPIAQHLGYQRFDVVMHTHGGLIGPKGDSRVTTRFTLTEQD